MLFLHIGNPNEGSYIVSIYRYLFLTSNKEINVHEVCMV